MRQIVRDEKEPGRLRVGEGDRVGACNKVRFRRQTPSNLILNQLLFGGALH